MSKVDEMYKYSDKSERYQDAFLFYSNNIINELIIQETKDKNNKGKLLSERYEKVLSIYDNESIQIEIENEFIDYFGFISGYLNHSRREFVTKFNLNQIAERYNMISRVVIDEINNGKKVSFMQGSSTIMPSSEINDYNKIQIIYIIGFILNSYASDIYSSSSYMKESLALSDKSH